MFAENPLLHTSTFGGNPMACAAGLATLRAIEEESLLENCSKMGERMLNGLKSVQSAHPDMIADVRGRGLMIGVELTMDEVGELTVAQMLKRGMVAAYTLNNPRVIRFEPPLIINESEVDRAVNTFGEALQETTDLLAELVGM
jgi:putrescine aminotransferase